MISSAERSSVDDVCGAGTRISELLNRADGGQVVEG
jgi:hypothetical protein